MNESVAFGGAGLRPWRRRGADDRLGNDAIVNVWSTSKTMTALCVLILADRGEPDLDAPVAMYSPEFAAAGKKSVRVRHFLGHTAGLPDGEGPATVEDLAA